MIDELRVFRLLDIFHQTIKFLSIDGGKVKECFLNDDVSFHNFEKELGDYYEVVCWPSGKV